MGRLVRRGALIFGAGISLSLAVLILILVGLPNQASFIGHYTEGQIPVAPAIGALAPPFTATLLDGERISLSELQGVPVILNFWATWCAPCEIEMPELQSVYQAHTENPVRVVAVNLGESADTMRQWVDSFGLTFDIVRDENGQIPALYQLRGQPTTFIISPGGIITEIFYGPTTAHQLNAALSPLLTE